MGRTSGASALRGAHSVGDSFCNLVGMIFGDHAKLSTKSVEGDGLDLERVGRRGFPQAILGCGGDEDEPGVWREGRLPIGQRNDDPQREPAHLILVDNDGGPNLADLRADGGLEVDKPDLTASRGCRLIEDFEGELTQVGEFGMIAVERLGQGG